jgi:hypothetical protein
VRTRPRSQQSAGALKLEAGVLLGANPLAAPTTQEMLVITTRETAYER